MACIMAQKPTKTFSVCGVRVRISRPQTYGGGHIYSGARDIGTFAAVSTRGAKSIAKTLNKRLPRPGWEISLGGDTFLVNKGSSFEIDHRRSGGFPSNVCPVRRGKK